MNHNIFCFYSQDINRIDELELKRNDVHIWKIRWSEIIEYIDANLDLLDSEERKRADRYFHIEDCRRYLTGKVLSKKLIKHYLRLSVDRIAFQIDQYGKPHYYERSHDEKVYFNISHSGAWVFMAFSLDSKLGIDVEEKKELANYQKIAQKVFSKEEYEYMVESNDISVFYNIWSGKEAYIKWIGLGLSYDVTSFSIIDALNNHLNGEENKYRITPLHEEGYAGYFIMDN